MCLLSDDELDYYEFLGNPTPSEDTLGITITTKGKDQLIYVSFTPNKDTIEQWEEIV